jgi:hypothetical protein
MRKFIALFLVFYMLAISTNLYAKEKHGAELIVVKKDGGKAEGELIAVKENVLLLKLSYSSYDVSIDIDDVNVIKIMKESKALLGAGLGFLSGAGVGAIFGLVIGPRDLFWGPQQSALLGGAIGGLAGVIVGGYIGAGKEPRIRIEGRSPKEIKEILEKLRKKARIPDYQ